MARPAKMVTASIFLVRGPARGCSRDDGTMTVRDRDERTEEGGRCPPYINRSRNWLALAWSNASFWTDAYSQYVVDYFPNFHHGFFGGSGGDSTCGEFQLIPVQSALQLTAPLGQKRKLALAENSLWMRSIAASGVSPSRYISVIIAFISR